MWTGAPEIRSTWAEIDITALCKNAELLSRLTGTPLYAVVKADAYGHGASLLAGTLADSGHVAGLAVSLIEEGLELRDAGVTLPILVMGPALVGGFDELIARGLTAVASDLGDLEALALAARRRQMRVTAHLKIDTGMGRLGIAEAELSRAFDRVRSLAHVDITGLSTHFACSDEDDPLDPGCMTNLQLDRFARAVALARRMGIAPRVLHTANSAAALRFPASRYDFVRCGIALYGNGVQPDSEVLQPVMRLVSQIAHMRQAEPGSTVSYGALWRATRPTRLAVIPIGYADGLPRSVTGKGCALIGGQRCPLVGAISMDMCVADVTDLAPEARTGDEVVLLGRQAGARITAKEYASWAGCTEYEVTCGVSKRVPRKTRRDDGWPRPSP